MRTVRAILRSRCGRRSSVTHCPARRTVTWARAVSATAASGSAVSAIRMDSASRSDAEAVSFAGQEIDLLHGVAEFCRLFFSQQQGSCAFGPYESRTVPVKSYEAADGGTPHAESWMAKISLSPEWK